MLQNPSLKAMNVSSIHIVLVNWLLIELELIKNLVVLVLMKHRHVITHTEGATIIVPALSVFIYEKHIKCV